MSKQREITVLQYERGSSATNASKAVRSDLPSQVHVGTVRPNQSLTL